MQTFLPYMSYAKSAHVLDNKRLGKQRVEVIQILNALRKPNYGWQNHPAVKMWEHWRYALCEYGLTICAEWRDRGFKDTCLDKINDHLYFIDMEYRAHGIRRDMYPEWLEGEFGDRVILSHRSNLIRKDPDHYRQFWPDVPDDIPYFWPSHAASQGEQQAA